MADPAGHGAPRVDEANQCIWRGDQRIELVPKAFLVLRCLMQRPNQIVSKDELLEAAWPGTHVMEGVLKVAINQLRDALGDDSQQPRFIETVHRRGYRWVGAIDAPVPVPTLALSESASEKGEASLLVGRERALAQLEQALARATAGSRQVIFVTGDPGIGKSTVLDAFAARLSSSGAVSVGSLLLAQGQCVDGYGTSDAYMPLLQALAQVCRQSTSADIAALLRRFAPTWLVQLPQLLDAGEQAELRRSLAGSTSERMVHDLLAFVEALTERRTLVLLLEDIHWSDHATVAALAGLATRREPARLMIVASYRDVEAVVQLHPITRLKHELTSKRLCQEIALEGLGRADIDAYLAGRFPDHQLPAELSGLLQQQTSGNPLFMLNALEELVHRGRLKERAGVWECTVDPATLADAVPDTTRDMIGFRLEQISSPDLELLEAASVVGPIFPTQALAAMLEREPAAVEQDCRRIARTSRVFDEGEPVDWVDGRTGVQYSFRHALYRQVLYARVTPARSRMLHLRFAECLERGFGKEARTLTSQLSHHFERGGDLRRAAEYRRKAASRALDRFAYRQAIEHLRAGLDILRGLPASAERDSLELELQTELLTPVYAATGSNSDEMTEVIERIHALSKRGGPIAPGLFGALATLVSAHCTRGEMRPARRVSEQLVEGADGEPWETIAAGILGFCQMVLGEIEAGTRQLERSSALPDLPGPLDPGTVATGDATIGHLLLGQPSQALDWLARATRRAAASKHHATIAHVARCGVRAGTILLDDDLVSEHVAILTSLPIQIRVLTAPWCEIAEGWLEIRRGHFAGAERIERGRQRLFEIGIRGYQALFAAMAATGLLRDGRLDDASALLDQGLALVEESGEYWCQAEVHRLKGELYLARASADEAEQCFRKSLEVARAQGARWWELRTSTSLARLLGDSGRGSEARQLLSDVYGGFEEGVDLPDLRAARELLKSLGD